jgi:hypothetical protein
MNAEQTDPGREATPDPAAPLTPLRAVLLILVLLATATTLLLLTRGGAPPSDLVGAPSQGSGLASSSPSRAEALQIFRELRSDALRATRSRDLDLVREVFLPGSRIARVAREEVEKLLRKKVRERSVVRSVEALVLKTTSENVRIRETFMLTPCFLSQKGEDVTQNHVRLRHVVEWAIQPLSSRWVLADGTLVAERVVKRGLRSCA